MLPEGERAESRVGPLQRGDLDELVAAMRIARRAGAEVDPGNAARREVRDVRPGLLGLDLEVAHRAQGSSQGGGDGDGAGRRVAQDLDVRIRRDERAEQRFCLRRRTVRRVAEVHRGDGAVGHDVVREAGRESGHRHHLEEREPLDDRLTTLLRRDPREPLDRAMQSVVRKPRARGVPTDTVECDACGEIPHAARLDREVGGLQEHRESGLVQERACVEGGGQWIVARRKLLATEQEQRDVGGPGVDACKVPHELECDCNPSLHVARPTAMYRATLDPTWNVVLRRHRVVVTREEQQRRLRTALGGPHEGLVPFEHGYERRGHELSKELPNLRLVPALRRDVHELECATRQSVAEVGHAGEPTFGNRRGILPAMTAAGHEHPGVEPERGLLLAVLSHGVDELGELGELGELARAAGVEPVGHVVQHRQRPDPRTYVGKGKLEELQEAYHDALAEVLLVDDELQPTQQRALEDALSARVVDRTQLILDIFAQHAVSAEGKLQVELAQLEYNLPRMRGMWKHLERLAGGGGTAQVGGGVGTRGPGESQLETDRRLANRRITLLRRRLRDVGAHRATRRKARARSETPTVALAGYTNAGKSTLLNALTGADVSVEDRLFETLDPTTRSFVHAGKRYLVTDTVGFIRRLPTQLVEGFASTLEETLVADVILHVVDGSLPDDTLTEQVDAVEAVLDKIGAGGVPVELVVNKVDRLDALARRRLANRFPSAVHASAATGEGVDALQARIAARFADRYDEVRLLVPFDEGRVLSELYALGAPIDERLDTEAGVLVRARLSHRDVRRFAPYLVAGNETEDVEQA